MIRVDHLVIGGGVVGLAIGKELSKLSHKSTFVIEKLTNFGMETSSRNSQVIHSGIYYPIDSLKTSLCIKGRHLLYSFLQKYRIPHAKIGKFIVSTNKEEDEDLEKLYQKSNQLKLNLGYVSSQNVSLEEPNLLFSRVLHSPETGILDSHALMETLQNLISDQGGHVFYRTEAIKIEKANSGFYIYLKDSTVIHADWVINSTGLQSNDLSCTLRPIKKSLYYVKGHYLKYNGYLVSRLIYPIPDRNLKGLGIHATLDLSGSLKFGPDVQYITNNNDYSFPKGREEEELIQKFYTAISKYLKGVDKAKLSIDYTGIRPKLSGENDGFHDFVIEKEEEGFINLLGIESPGLTSSLAIGEYVYDMIYK